MNLLLSVTVMAVAVVAPVAPAGASEGTGPFDAARHATEQATFQGSVDVQWHDGDVTRHEEVFVEDTSGSLHVQGGAAAFAVPGHERLVEHGTEWDRLWPVGLASSSPPDSTQKYEAVAEGQTPVAGRMTEVVEVRQGRLMRERLYLDDETGLLLRRDQFDTVGNTDRKVEFTSFTVGAPTPPPELPGDTVDETPRPVAAARQPTTPLAPARLPDGYDRVGVYRDAGVLHLLYSDGLYDLSLFEQPGRLARSDLPLGGAVVRLGGSAGRLYAWPGGHAVTWQVGPNVLTMVSDAPADELLRAAGSVRAGNSAPSLLSRLRRAARALVAPFGD